MFNPTPKPTFKKRKKERGNPKLARKEVIAADGENCLLCGDYHNLQLHRIIYASQGGLYESNNCVLLCVYHHAAVHSNKPKWMPWLLEHVKKRGG